MGIDAPNNFANLQTKVDQLLILQLLEECIVLQVKA